MVVVRRGATVREMHEHPPPLGELITAAVTPFGPSGAVDYERFARLVRHLRDTGSDGVLVSGTTGESPVLTHDEKAMLFATAVDAARGKMTVVAGTGTYDTAESVEMTRVAAEAGCDAVLAVTPYYSRPPQEGLRRHFTAIAEATELPVILYNIPGRTARIIEVETLASLAGHPHIAGVKDAVDDIEYTRRSLEMLPPDFQVYAGSDHMTRDIVAAGGVGVISVSAHLVARQLKALVGAVKSGDETRAKTIDDALAPLNEALFMEPNPMPVKAAVDRWWEPVGEPRLPLVPASAATLDAIERALETAAGV
jgi:4-hydroxy-tetrahydrodipicolinate synthase